MNNLVLKHIKKHINPVHLSGSSIEKKSKMIELVRRIPAEETNTSNIGSVLSMNNELLAFVLDDKTIQIANVSFKNRPLVTLKGGHYEQIKCLRISSDSLLLCSCSIDRILVWDLSTFEWKLLQKKLEYEPNQCEFSPNNEKVTVCYGDYLSVFQIDSSEMLYCLKFQDYLSGVEFFKFDPRLVLMTTSQNSSILVFDLELQKMRNMISSEHGFNLVCSLQAESSIVASTLDGFLCIYEAVKSADFLLVNKVALETLYDNYLKNKNKAGYIKDEERNDSFLCLSLHLLTFESGTRIEFDAARKTTTNVIVCCTISALFFIDYHTCDLINLIDFKRLCIQNKSRPARQQVGIPQAIDVKLLHNSQVNVAYQLLFQNEISVVKCAEVVAPSPSKIAYESAQCDDQKIDEIELEILSVFPKMSLLDNSPLNEKVPETEKLLKKVPSMQEYLKFTSSLKKTPVAKDKPLTFQNKIKSSGYSRPAVKRDKFTPLINKSRSLRIPNIEAQKSTASKSKSPPLLKPEFQFELPMVLDKKFNTGDRPSAITHMKFTDDGQHLAVASADNVIQYLDSNALDKSGPVFNCHIDIVRSIDLSHDCKFLLSTGDDKTCKLWSLKKTNEILIDMNAIKISDSKSYQFRREIVAGNFFYLDKFILIGTENKILLCKYFIDSKKNDVQRYLNGTYSKLVKEIEMSCAPSITAMAAVNSFYSYIVITSGSDKSIEVFDINQAKSCLSIPEVHTRNIHQICLNSSQHNANSYDWFLTSAVGDGVKMWDLRSAQCINHFDMHINRCLPAKVSFSPDSFYVSVGSEDKSAFVYDLRMNGSIQKYGVFSDSVTNAQFNPRKSQLVCGTQDGKVYSYKPKKTN